MRQSYNVAVMNRNTFEVKRLNIAATSPEKAAAKTLKDASKYFGGTWQLSGVSNA